MYLGFEEIAVNPYTFACLLAGQKRSHDRAMRVQTGGDVGGGNADFARRSVRFSGSGLTKTQNFWYDCSGLSRTYASDPPQLLQSRRTLRPLHMGLSDHSQ